MLTRLRAREEVARPVRKLLVSIWQDMLMAFPGGLNVGYERRGDGVVSWFGTWMRRMEDFFLREGKCLGMEIKNLV